MQILLMAIFLAVLAAVGLYRSPAWCRTVARLMLARAASLDAQRDTYAQALSSLPDATERSIDVWRERAQW